MAEFHHSSLAPDASDIGDILRRKRRMRPRRACQPCRYRKVNALTKTPCQSCSEPGHPELCSYDHLPKRVDAGQPTIAFSARSSDRWTPSRVEWDEMCRRLSALERRFQHLQPDDAESLDQCKI
jgi:hypothetical protein